MSLDPQQLRSALATFATGVTIVTTCDFVGNGMGIKAAGDHATRKLSDGQKHLLRDCLQQITLDALEPIKAAIEFDEISRERSNPDGTRDVIYARQDHVNLADQQTLSTVLAGTVAYEHS